MGHGRTVCVRPERQPGEVRSTDRQAHPGGHHARSAFGLNKPAHARDSHAAASAWPERLTVVNASVAHRSVSFCAGPHQSRHESSGSGPPPMPWQRRRTTPLDLRRDVVPCVTLDFPTVSCVLMVAYVIHDLRFEWPLARSFSITYQLPPMAICVLSPRMWRWPGSGTVTGMVVCRHPGVPCSVLPPVIVPTFGKLDQPGAESSNPFSKQN